MSRSARQAEHAYLQRRARERAPRLVVGDVAKNDAVDAACKCGFLRGHGKHCAMVQALDAIDPQPAPKPQATRFSVGDVVRCVRGCGNMLVLGAEYVIDRKRDLCNDYYVCGSDLSWNDDRFELVRRAGEAQPAPAGQSREGWKRTGGGFEFGTKRAFESPLQRGCYFVRSVDRSVAEAEYPTLDAAMDAVEEAVLASEGWTRNGYNGGCYWKHERGAEVSLSRARKAWAYAPNGECRWVSAESWPKTRAEAMRLALGQVTQ